MKLSNKHGKQGLFILFVAALAMVLYFLVRSCGENDESRIRKAIYAGVAAIESKDPAKYSRLISESYQDNYGNHKPNVVKIVSRILGEYQDFKVVVKQIKIDIKDVSADASVGFTCYLKKAQDAQIYYDNGKLNIGFYKENGSWRVRSAEYLGSNEMLFLQTVA